MADPLPVISRRRSNSCCEIDTVKSKSQPDRPDMVVVSKLPYDRYFMSYEICGPSCHCSVFSRMSKNGWDWGNPAKMSTKVVSTTGQ